MRRAAGLVLVAMLGGAATGCAPVINNHGYAPDDALLAGITVGEDTRSSVQRKIGRPGMTGVFNDTGWYYVASTVKNDTYHAPEVIDRRVVAVEFDDDVVSAVHTYGIDDGRIIDLQTRTTPTYGRRLTILQQLIGNLATPSAEQLLNQ
jgi:outer membrane protein assembly factor BamE (lipoprotein component of BamABCDE complex)